MTHKRAEYNRSGHSQKNINWVYGSVVDEPKISRSWFQKLGLIKPHQGVFKLNDMRLQVVCLYISIANEAVQLLNKKLAGWVINVNKPPTPYDLTPFDYFLWG